MQKEQQTRTDSEILLKLMMGYRNGGQPDGEELTLWECLRLYRRLIEEEARASGKKEQQKESQKPQEIPRYEAKAKESKKNFDGPSERYEYQKALAVDPLNKGARQLFADMLSRDGLYELYLEQLKFIKQNFTDASNPLPYC